MINFLKNYAYFKNSEETRKLLDEKMQLINGNLVDRENCDECVLSVDKILAQNSFIRPPSRSNAFVCIKNEKVFD